MVDSIADRISTQTEAAATHQEISNHIPLDLATPVVSGHEAKYAAAKASVAFDPNSEIIEHRNSARQIVEGHAAAKAGNPAAVMSDAEKAELTRLGNLAHPKLDELSDQLESHGKALTEAHSQGHREIVADLQGNHLTAEQADRARADLNKEYNTLKAQHGEAEKLVKAERENISKLTGVASKYKVAEAAVKAPIAKDVNGKRLAIGAAEWEKRTHAGKFKEAAAQKWEHAGPVKKGMIGIGTGAGVIIALHGLKDVGRAVGAVHDTDMDGKDVTPDGTGSLIKGVGELGAGGALAYFSLTRGGKELAMHGK